MDKNFTFLGKFYFKNGIIIEDRMSDKYTNRDNLENFIYELKIDIKNCFEENNNFQFTFGSTTIRCCELIAFTITIE